MDHGSGFKKSHSRGGSKLTADTPSTKGDCAGKRLGSPESDPLKVDKGLTSKTRGAVHRGSYQG